jgi:hypothetical protein
MAAAEIVRARYRSHFALADDRLGLIDQGLALLLAKRAMASPDGV